MFAQRRFTAMVGANLFTEHSAQFCGANLASSPHSLFTLPLRHSVEPSFVPSIESSLLLLTLPEQVFVSVMQSSQL